MRGKRFDETRPWRDVCHTLTSEQVKVGLRLRAHAWHVFSRVWDRPNLGPPHRPHDVMG